MDNQHYGVTETAATATVDPIPAPRTNTIRDINIRQLNFGYVVAVGCHSFAFETVDKMVEKLTQYFKEPQATEDKWFKGELL